MNPDDYPMSLVIIERYGDYQLTCITTYQTPDEHQFTREWWIQPYHNPLEGLDWQTFEIKDQGDV